MWPRIKLPLHLHLQQLHQAHDPLPPNTEERTHAHFSVRMPLERITIHIGGPFLRHLTAKKIIPDATDCFTQFVKTFPMRNHEAYCMAHALVNGWFPTYPPPTAQRPRHAV